ncbi:hypothetical protein ONS95_013037 [Cadophora gregata]|uniref:uncharacterized protein n=1 Tax=Cadophora gregata TaxID=51156 RepID=UPI0026DB7480|nr:uncharacterized protein ONS95_013037 [Cadophora gregata]KAK0100974.1 hypothetical protein ONS96_006206 [Cadophora gregata f. sp. sojae]KAK0116000.1 hypothetical protein ONS95_013037 [Cadophora gregata]
MYYIRVLNLPVEESPVEMMHLGGDSEDALTFQVSHFRYAESALPEPLHNRDPAASGLFTPLHEAEGHYYSEFSQALPKVQTPPWILYHPTPCRDWIIKFHEPVLLQWVCAIGLWQE